MKFKYYYNNEPAIEYCKKHPEYKYNQLTNYVSKKLKENPARSIQEIIDEFFNKPHRTYNKYIINGMNLIGACKEENVSYDAVSKDISRSKRDKRYSNMSEEEIVSMVLDKHLMGEIEELVLDNSKKLTLKPKKDRN